MFKKKKKEEQVIDPTRQAFEEYWNEHYAEIATIMENAVKKGSQINTKTGIGTEAYEQWLEQMQEAFKTVGNEQNAMIYKSCLEKLKELK